MDKIVNNTDATYKLITSSIKLIFDEESTYERNTHTDKEFEDFVASLNTLQFQKLVTFFQEMPSLKHEVEWTCPICKKSEIHIKSENYEIFCIIYAQVGSVGHFRFNDPIKSILYFYDLIFRKSFYIFTYY